MKHNNRKFYPFGDSPKKKTKAVKTRVAEHKTKSFGEVKTDLFKKYNQYKPGWGSIFRNRLILELKRLHKNGLYKDEINSLKYINEGIYNEMVNMMTNKIPKKKN